MIFTEESQIVKNYNYLIENKEITIDQVPDLYNLIECVKNLRGES